MVKSLKQREERGLPQTKCKSQKNRYKKGNHNDSYMASSMLRATSIYWLTSLQTPSSG